MPTAEITPRNGLAIEPAKLEEAAELIAFLDRIHPHGRCIHTFDPTAGEGFPGHFAAVDALARGHWYVAREHGGIAGAVWFDTNARNGPAIGIAIGDADDREAMLDALIMAARDHAMAEGVTHFTMLFPVGHPGLRAAFERAAIKVQEAIAYGGTAEITLVMPCG